jgi:hypothetical protein
MPKVSLAQAARLSTSEGTARTSVAICSPRSCPKTTRKTARKTTVPSMTRAVANPRRMRLLRRATAGSIAIEAMTDMTSMKMTLPASESTHLPMAASATTATTVQPARHMLRRSKCTRTSVASTSR